MMNQVISVTGGEYTYVELKMSRVGKAIVLAAELVVNGRFTSQEDREELAREVVEEEDMDDTEGLAIDAATDLERVADAKLEELRVRGRRGLDFGKAVEKAIDKAKADEKAPALAAE